MFDKKGQFVVDASAASEEQLMEVVLEAGAEDLQQVDDAWEISTPPEAFDAVQQALEKAGISVRQAAIIKEPQSTVELDEKKTEQCLKLLEALDDHDDVQEVWANLSVGDSADGK